VSDLPKWMVHGPVRSVKTGFAEWDLAQEEWRAPQHHNEDVFHTDGKLEETRHFNPDGTMARTKNLYGESGLLIETQFWMGDSLRHRTFYSYDDAGRQIRTVSLSHDGNRQEAEASTYDSLGRKTTVRYLFPQEGGAHTAYSIEGMDHGYGAPGAVNMTTVYDANHLPVEVLFRDAQNALVRRIVFTRDEAGRPLKEECLFGDQPPFPEAEAQGHSGGVPMAEILAKVFGLAQAFSTITYAYNENGLLVERARRIGSLGEERTTFRYDEHRNPIEESTVHEDREYGAYEQGELHVTKERPHTQHTRFEYRYDKEGNWMERVVWSRLEPNPNFECRNVERCEITYHARAAG
jgi:hypothetical protein